MKVLLSIKPEYAERIFSGDKKYEFRRVVFKNTEANTVVVYASAPISKVVGEFEIGGILADSPEQLWEVTKKHAGIDDNFFFEYFSGRNVGYAIKVKNPKKYSKALDVREHFSLAPPQSFAYII